MNEDALKNRTRIIDLDFEMRDIENDTIYLIHKISVIITFLYIYILNFVMKTNGHILVS